MGEAKGPPAALRFGPAGSSAAVVNVCSAAAKDAGLPADTLRNMDAVVGLAGVGRKGSVEALAARPHPFRSVRYVSDATIACVGAHGGRDGGVVIVGTGSVGIAISGGHETRIGGYGFPISDEGSGAALGLAAIRSALKAFDRRVEPTSFTNEIMRPFQGDPFEAVAWMDEATATDYARFAPLVLECAERGNPRARQIVKQAAEDIDGLGRELVRRGALRLALLGGLAKRMQPFLAPDVQARIVPAIGDAIDGALLMARSLTPESTALREGT